MINMRSTRVKQFLLEIVKFVFCYSKNTTKLYLSGKHNSKITRHKIICGLEGSALNFFLSARKLSNDSFEMRAGQNNKHDTY